MREYAVFCCIHRMVLVLLCGFALAGCGQRIRAEVSAVVEQGYQAQGQTFALDVMPGFSIEDRAAAQKAVEMVLLPSLQNMGYAAAVAGQEPDVQVRVWWFSTGPHPVYRTVGWRDMRDGRDGRYGYRRYGHRRQSVVVEDEYARYLVVEGILVNAPVPVSASVPVVETYSTPQEASRVLPAPPARLLWRVRVESRGNLSRAERVLMSLTAAAAPFMGKSGVLHVLVREEEVVAAEAVAP